MSRTQEANEVKYKVAVKLLKIMLRNGIIFTDEYQKIDDLNYAGRINERKMAEIDEALAISVGLDPALY